MRLSTSTNLLALKENGSVFPQVEAIRKLHTAGFKVLDMNFALCAHNDFFIANDDWENKTAEIAEEAEKLGIEFSQCHIPFYGTIEFMTPEKREIKEVWVKRAFHAAKMLGVKWAVMHAYTDTAHNCEFRASKEMNLKYLAPHIELAKKMGVGIAIENMAHFYGSPILRRYTATYEELADLVDTINDSSVGACWDFGHANIMKFDQKTALRYMGKRLKATHVADNVTTNDLHVAPFFGNVEWKGVMTTLAEIGYEGDFTFEAHGMTNKLPDALKDISVDMTYAIGQYLLSIVNI